jgi:hypothetical protein
LTPHDPAPKKKRLTPTSLLFHLLFSDDTWRVAIGTTAAIVSAPYLLPFDHTGMGRYVMFITVVVLGWAISKVPAQWIARQFRAMFPNR